MTVHYMAVISKRYGETTIHYNVTALGLSFSVTIEEYIKALVTAMEVPEAKWLQRKPTMTKEELLERLMIAMSKVNEEIKQVSVHQPPPLVLDGPG